MDGDAATRRFFTALPVSGAFRDLCDALPRKGLEGRWITGADLHITIRFLGDIDPARLDDIDTALRRVKRPPFYVDIARLDLFENKSQSILYAKVESTRKLTTLCADITDLLTPLGFDFGTRPFVPHVTLARLNRGSAGAARAFIKKHARTVQGHWQAQKFALMASGPEGEKSSKYSMLREYALNG